MTSETLEQAAEKEAEERYPAHPGKHWVRTLRNERVKSFVNGSAFGSNWQKQRIVDLLKERERNFVNVYVAAELTELIDILEQM